MNEENINEKIKKIENRRSSRSNRKDEFNGKSYKDYLNLDKKDKASIERLESAPDLFVDDEDKQNETQNTDCQKGGGIKVDNCFEQLNDIENKLLAADIDYEKEIVAAIENNPSQLDAYDLAFSITFGVIGATITTSKAIQEYLDEIHKLSSDINVEDADWFQKLLGKLLYHKGDWIDQGENYYKELIKNPKYIMDFTARDGGVNHGPHRIFWGHDIFSFGKDNPFYLSVKQYGLLKGIFRAFSHIIADTCSTQGLPLPGHSWFDYKTENGISNHLLDFCKKYSKEVLGNAQGGANSDVFNHFFSIHAQDVASQGLTTFLSTVYLKARGITDKMRCCQFRVVSSFVNFYGGCIIGTIKSGGIPFINWPAAIVLIKNNIQMVYISNKETRELLFKTELIVDEGAEIICNAGKLDEQITNDLFHTLNGTINQGRDSFIQFLGKE